MYELGANVILAIRNKEKGVATIEDIKKKYPNAQGILEVMVLDTSDLESVQHFAKEYKKQHGKLDILVNNAGIHYMSMGAEMLDLSRSLKSAQGYDLAFSTNYLGHFLLCQLLTDLLNQTAVERSQQRGSPVCSRVVSVSSSYHFQSDGSMLIPDGSGVPPAARGDINTLLHRRRQYGNNKLAQVLHAKELQRRFEQQGKNIKVFSICPGWVNTNILPKNALGEFISHRAYSPSAGSLSAVTTIFDTSLKGGEFVSNSKNFWTNQSWSHGFLRLLTRWGIRDWVVDLLGVWILLFQSSTYGRRIEQSSPESYELPLAASLFDWSQSAVQKYE